MEASTWRLRANSTTFGLIQCVYYKNSGIGRYSDTQTCGNLSTCFCLFAIYMCDITGHYCIFLYLIPRLRWQKEDETFF
jgi:hypothetical protein